MRYAICLNLTWWLLIYLQTARLQMPPPPPSPNLVVSAVKTPRPDISIGLHDPVVARALQSQGFDEGHAGTLLVELQDTVHGSGNEPLLRSEPTQQITDMRFPFLVVEGKTYATVSSFFEAQNQVAVSGACALKILYDLDNVANRARPGSQSNDQPIIFSICTQGPYHELWAHYVLIKNGIRTYQMSILKTCNAALRDELLGFLKAVDNVIRWGTGALLDQISKQLGDVAKAAQGSTAEKA